MDLNFEAIKSLPVLLPGEEGKILEFGVLHVEQ